MPSAKKRLVHEPLELRILLIRGYRVILDADLARLYGVTTRVLNQGVKRNPHRFPDDFAFRLTATENAKLRSQFEASRTETLEPITDTSNRSQIVTGSQKHRDPRFRLWAFTEHGALMAANILRSRRAVQMSIYVIRAFVRLREQIAANRAILQRLAEIDKTL
ncbi:MAG: ORF6N domain-containing protein [Deltaproteobacteria bacterium]|nr:ORF6N domain-containing protein [Deltaproteobacteria bacterium]